MSEAKPQHPPPKSRSGPSSGSFKVARVQVQELGAVASPQVFEAPAADLLGDELLVERVLRSEPELYEVLMPRARRNTRGASSVAMCRPRTWCTRPSCAPTKIWPASIG